MAVNQTLKVNCAHYFYKYLSYLPDLWFHYAIKLMFDLLCFNITWQFLSYNLHAFYIVIQQQQQNKEVHVIIL